MQQQEALPGAVQVAAAAAADGAPQFPTLAPFPTCLAPPVAAEAVSPISSRAPDSGVVNFDAAGFAVDEEALAGGAPGNRWPRQETLALLKIRSEMDAAFREATFKGPLWEEVSRELEELGYKRSAKKCKEKFENVHKYYKRTKEGRAGRQDGKAYRFFSQLEALHNNAAAAAAAAAGGTPPAQVSFRMQPLPVSAVAMAPAGGVPSLGQQQQPVLASAPPGPAGIGSFGWNNSSSSSSSLGPESDDEDTEDDGVDGEGEGEGEGSKRKRRGGSRKMMAFFEGLMMRVTERQDEMQRRFLEAIEKREQERMIREESWRRQEMARFGREQELLAQERALAASRDVAVISYLQKITSGAQTTSPPLPPVSAVAVATIPISVTETLPPTPQPTPQAQLAPSKKKPAAMPLVAAEEGGVGILEPPLSSSRWPKAEVHALIDLRSRLEARYQEAGPKGLLWEEISAGMRALGYDRSAKRCKEKWENINKYFKKVKDGNKRRPEDAKTCPYFHQLEALYRKKHHGDAGAMAFPPPPPPPPPPPAAETAGGNSQPLPTNNNEGTLRKAEEAVKDLMEPTQRQSLDLDEYDSENMEQDDEEDVDDEDDDEDTKMQYKIQFQQHNVGGGPGGSTSAAAAPPPPAPGSSFLAMVQ